MLKQTQAGSSLELGVYLHIPFCRFVCHYCDFAKTALWSQELKSRYMQTLAIHLETWLNYLKSEFNDISISTVNVGGGTPSVITKEYEQIFLLLNPYIKSDCEISIEANPNDCKKSNLARWKGYGFNRISVGVQTFQEKGLQFLKRDHNTAQAIESIENCLTYFENTNIDLIYSWPAQTLKEWKKDLSLAHTLDCNHLSLYNLTYAKGTPIGRARQRGKIMEPQDESQELLYTQAREYLGNQGFIHEEVSNWSKPGFSCKHNWLYWLGKPYLGVGSGAHGYLPITSPIGLRYHYKRRERNFQSAALGRKPLLDFSNLIEVETRDSEAWLLEMLGSSLRTHRGLDLVEIKRKTGKTFIPSNEIELGIANKLIKLDKKQLTLHPQEWFREVHWCLKISECFKAEHK